MPASSNNVSDADWEKMKLMISDQLDGVTLSLEELRQNGSLETIAQMIRRGDKFPSARLQAWYHALLEAEYCNRPAAVSQKLSYMYRKHSSNGPNATVQSFILDTTLTAESSGKEEWKRRSGRPLESPKSVVARLEKKRNLSVVERQELWLAQKTLKAAKAKSAIAEERAQERAISAPDLTKSRRSFSVASQDGKPPARPSSTAVRKRSISSATGVPNALGNKTNHSAPTNQRKRQKRLPGPISDPFGQKLR
ncbi:hypothetical protein ACHAXT_000518 [Thalassiosira profunda]